MIEVKDRVPTKPNRIKLVSEEDGTSKYYTLSRADEPTVDGTPINKALFDSIQVDLTNQINESTFKYVVGTSNPTTETCPEGYFYFKISA